MRIILLSLCLALPAAAADRAQLTEQVADAEARLEALRNAHASRTAAATAELERVRAAGDRDRADAEEQVSVAQAAFADASRARPGGHGAARGRHLQLAARNVTPELAARLAVPEVRGALVGKIKIDGDGYLAGLRAGDVILMFDGLPVAAASDLSALAKRAARGRKVYVEVWRDRANLIVGLPAVEEPRVKRARGRLERSRDNLAAALAKQMERMRAVEAELTELGEAQAKELGAARAELDALRTRLAALNKRFGVKLTQLPDDVARYFQVSGGAYVRAVDTGSRAAETGLEPADIVVRFDGARVRDARHLTELLRDLGTEESVRVEVLRNGETRELTTPGALDT